MADEWTVVGASGKAKQPKKRHTTTAAANAAAAHITAAQEPQHLPGWEGPSGWTPSQHVHSLGHKPRSRRKQYRERTFEEQVEHLNAQVIECRHQVSQSRLYQNLKAAVARSASHTLQCPAAAAAEAAAAVPACIATPDSAVAHIDLTQPPVYDSVINQTHNNHAVQLSHTEQGVRQEASQSQNPFTQQTSDNTSTLQGHAGSRSSSDSSIQAQQTQQTQVPSTANSNGWNSGVQQLVCYGLGSLQDSRTSRYQLALLLLLSQDIFPCMTAPPEAYDPCFNEVDKALLQQLGVNVIDHDEQCARRALQPTFFWLPHLEGHMCDNLLAANWTAPGSVQQTDGNTDATGNTLPQCIILGNSFKTYQQRWDLWSGGKQQPHSNQRATASNSSTDACGSHAHHQEGRPPRPDTLLRLLAQGKVMELPVAVERDFPEPSAFNDTSLHLFHP